MQKINKLCHALFTFALTSLVECRYSVFKCVCTQPAAAALHSAREVIRCIIIVAAMKSTIMSVATVAVTKSVKPSVPFLPKKKTSTVGRENPDGLMRLHKFLYIFNLRQGAILIAVQHIALSACTLILLLVGISHAQEMMQVLNSDMEDNAEREGTYLIDDEDMTLFRESPGEATNNQQKFKIAQNLAMMVVIFLYGSLVTTAIYLMFSMALFYGAAKNKQEYIIPWAFLSSFAIIIMSGGLFLGDRSALLIKLCGGRASYRCVSTFLLIAHIYCIATVASFIYELRLVQKKICLSEEIKPRKTANGTVTIRFNPVVTEAHLV